MPLFGAHQSIAGGCHNAILTALQYGCQTVQMFTKNSNQWAGKLLTKEDIAIFRKALRSSGLKCPTSHDSYLINLASPDEVLNRRSVEAFVDELQRAEDLGLHYLVMHPGAHMGAGDVAGLARIVQALDEVHTRCRGYKVKVLLETTAGQGTALGHRFEHLRVILEHVAEPRRLGVCLDTCHIFAAGYAISTEGEYEATMHEFDRVIGFKHLKMFHLNDSAKPQGSRVDRHAHIGKGCLGKEPFRLLVNDPRFRVHPMIIETPKETIDGQDMDTVNLAVLRELAGEGEPVAG